MSRRSRDNLDLTDVEMAWEQARRIRIFEWIIKRRDLVSFARLADALARAPGSITRNESVRAQAIKDLTDAGSRGELGPWLFCLPDNVPTFRPYWVRRSPIGVRQMREYGGYQETAGLWVRRSEARKWLLVQGLPVPPWLTVPARPASAPAPQQRRKPPEKEFAAWVAAELQATGKNPSSRQAKAWAISKGYSTDQVNGLHKALNNPVGRPRKTH